MEDINQTGPHWNQELTRGRGVESSVVPEEEVTITLPASARSALMLGSAHRNLKMIREGLGVKITARGDQVRLAGERGRVEAARRALDELADAAGQGRSLSRSQMLSLLAEVSAGREGSNTNGAQTMSTPAPTFPLPSEGWEEKMADEPTSPIAGARGSNGALDVYAEGRRIRPQSRNQSVYLEALRTSDLVFGIGPAGTGKTYLAVAAAVHLLKTDEVRRVVLVRPAVEAGEKLGFLPGDMEAKVNPYLRPLFDALGDMMDDATLKRLMLHDVIEVAPLAFMRGRTLNGAMVILDEAQNTTIAQMKMFLTRMGRRSRMVVTGDMTQTDLPESCPSGLGDAVGRLAGAPGVACVELDRIDIVRHDLVQRIVQAYADGGRAAATGRPKLS